MQLDKMQCLKMMISFFDEIFGVEMGELKEAAVDCIICAWVEGWEEKVRRENNCASEVQLMA
jgi:hypothetical protein